MRQLSLLRDSDWTMTTLPVPDLVKLRQHLKGLLSILEMVLSRFNPVCRTCFYRLGLVDECQCKKDDSLTTSK